MIDASDVSAQAMPVWAAIYLTAYITFSLWAHLSDVKDRRFGAWAMLEIAGNLCLFVAALAYWSVPIRHFIGSQGALLFVAGLSAFIVFAIRKVRKSFADPQLSPKEKIGFSVSGVVFVTFVNLPLIWWGAQLVSDHRVRSLV